jgi:hypothetical protein
VDHRTTDALCFPEPFAYQQLSDDLNTQRHTFYCQFFGCQCGPKIRIARPQQLPRFVDGFLWQTIVGGLPAALRNQAARSISLVSFAQPFHLPQRD